MGFKCGIVGLPNVGKSTIFNAVTSAGAESANYPFCTIDPNVGRVDVPDPRLDTISSIIKTQRVVPTSMEFVDIAGLVKGASQGEGLGNQFLGHIRSTDAIAHVVRCFEDGDIVHVDGSVSPNRDIDTIDTELVYADVSTVETALERNRKLNKSINKKYTAIVAMLEGLASHLQGIKPARTFNIEDFVGEVPEVKDTWRDLHLITAKPILYVCNVEESLCAGNIDNDFTLAVKARAKAEKAQVVIISGKIEEELRQLDLASRKEMLDSLGVEEPGLNRLIRAGYETLKLQTYFTAGEKEVHAWTINRGDKAPQAAGKIHSDFERGFICAEVYAIPDLAKAGSKAKLKEQGLIRTEGREYVVQDGDVMEFRFNV
ncbi:MAG: redox-regulated ATPase YchF [Proteobacteria bacterium]|nr:redox-regulated ATPase YchF [Pseudomonadota bacterium]